MLHPAINIILFCMRPVSHSRTASVHTHITLQDYQNIPSAARNSLDTFVSARNGGGTRLTFLQRTLVTAGETATMDKLYHQTWGFVENSDA